MKEMEAKFHDRGYTKPSTQAQRTKTSEVDRSTLLQDKKKTPGKRTLFSTTYNRHHPPIQRIIDRHWGIVQTNKEIAAAFSENGLPPE